MNQLLAERLETVKRGDHTFEAFLHIKRFQTGQANGRLGRSEACCDKASKTTRGNMMEPLLIWQSAQEHCDAKRIFADVLSLMT